MSKFKLITGDNVTSIVNNAGEMKTLEFEIQKKINPTDRDYIVYAYHFVRLGNLLLAQKYLNRLDSSYFDSMVYKDLSQALLLWSMNVATGGSMPDPAAKVYEYFIILKRIITMFDDVNFVSKPAFYRFKRQFQQFMTIPTT